MVDVWDGRVCQGDCDAADALFSAEFNACYGNAGGETATLLECVGKEDDVQTAGLEAAYERRLADATPEEKERLKRFRASWREAVGLRGELAGFEHGPGTAGVVERALARLYTVAQLRADLERPRKMTVR